jgi:hypothetical protein
MGMSKSKLAIAVSATALSLGCTSVARASIVLTFEGLQNLEPIDSYYDGGLGGDGSGPGPDYGITFGSDSLAIISGAAPGGSGNFSGQPSGVTVAFFLGGPGDVMDDPSGFTTGFSFYYSAVVYPGTVTVWSGLDGTGTELASIDLAVTPEGGPGCTYGLYCPWIPIGVAFSGTAESAIFSGTANYIGFDNITLGSSTPGGTPEPSTWVMMLAGFTGLGLVGLRRARAKAALA